ncbi:MAG: hypothetical protein ABWX90_01560 [Candidatus Saccharimonadales bacterium]
MTDIAAITAMIILAGLAAFQLALIFGAPLGKFAWGGAHTVLPLRLKIGSAISIFLYGIIASMIISKADIVKVIDNEKILNVSIWVIAVYFLIGIVMNGISRSKYERNLMTPVALVLSSMTILVALG